MMDQEINEINDQLARNFTSRVEKVNKALNAVAPVGFVVFIFTFSLFQFNHLSSTASKFTVQTKCGRFFTVWSWSWNQPYNSINVSINTVHVYPSDKF